MGVALCSGPKRRANRVKLIRRARDAEYPRLIEKVELVAAARPKVDGDETFPG
jgi:hypothetical protein